MSTLERARPDRRRVAPLLGVVALAAVLNTWALAQNGYANVYYSAGVKSMLAVVAQLPVPLRRPRRADLDRQAAARAVAAGGEREAVRVHAAQPAAAGGDRRASSPVAALYLIVRKRFGALAATASALTLAVFPSFVAVSRDNNVDTLLILLMTLACGAALRAIETGRLRTLLGSAVLVALAFNTKALAAYLVVPGIAAGYLWCAPGSLRRRVGQLLLAGVVCAALSLAWIVAVDLHARLPAPVRRQLDRQLRARADVRLQRLRTRRQPERRSGTGREPRSAARSRDGGGR